LRGERDAAGEVERDAFGGRHAANLPSPGGGEVRARRTPAKGTTLQPDAWGARAAD
jgi:hypothetical protein